MITVSYPIADLINCPLLSNYSKDILRKCEAKGLLPVVEDLLQSVTDSISYTIYDLDDEIAYHLEDWLRDNDFIGESEEL